MTQEIGKIVKMTVGWLHGSDCSTSNKYVVAMSCIGVRLRYGERLGLLDKMWSLNIDALFISAFSRQFPIFFLVQVRNFGGDVFSWSYTNMWR